MAGGPALSSVLKLTLQLGWWWWGVECGDGGTVRGVGDRGDQQLTVLISKLMQTEGGRKEGRKLRISGFKGMWPLSGGAARMFIDDAATAAAAEEDDDDDDGDGVSCSCSSSGIL